MNTLTVKNAAEKDPKIDLKIKIERKINVEKIFGKKKEDNFKKIEGKFKGGKKWEKSVKWQEIKNFGEIFLVIDKGIEMSTRKKKRKILKKIGKEIFLKVGQRKLGAEGKGPLMEKTQQGKSTLVQNDKNCWRKFCKFRRTC